MSIRQSVSQSVIVLQFYYFFVRECVVDLGLLGSHNRTTPTPAASSSDRPPQILTSHHDRLDKLRLSLPSSSRTHFTFQLFEQRILLFPDRVKLLDRQLQLRLRQLHLLLLLRQLLNHLQTLALHRRLLRLQLRVHSAQLIVQVLVVGQLHGQLLNVARRFDYTQRVSQVCVGLLGALQRAFESLEFLLL